jgi:succinate dehydrogenase/fumarate reductase flavoprotein subunit
MWQEAGLVRDAAGLRGALLRIGDGRASPQHQVARLLCWSALLRTESRGAHYRTDHPNLDSDWRGHLVLRQEEEPMLELA